MTDEIGPDISDINLTAYAIYLAKSPPVIATLGILNLGYAGSPYT